LAAGRDVALTAHEPSEQLVPGHGQGDDVDRHHLVVELPIELLLECLDRLVGHAHLAVFPSFY
jgi:hypothetical protein